MEHDDVAPTLRNRATLSRAEMIVMGGIAHSGLRPMAFGEVAQPMPKLRMSLDAGRGPEPLFNRVTPIELADESTWIRPTCAICGPRGEGARLLRWNRPGVGSVRTMWSA